MNENKNENKTPRRKTFRETFFGEGAGFAALAKQYGVPVLLAVYALFAVFAMPHCTRLKDAPSEDASFKTPAVTAFCAATRASSTARSRSPAPGRRAAQPTER